MAKLTELEIDLIKTDLSNIKEENYDGKAWSEEPDYEDDAQAHDDWMCETWDRFDELKLHDVYQDESYTHGIVAEQPEDMTVGEFYDLLSKIEETKIAIAG